MISSCRCERDVQFVSASYFSICLGVIEVEYGTDLNFTVCCIRFHLDFYNVIFDHELIVFRIQSL